MEIEQTTQKKPNFLLIFLLVCGSLLVMFVLAYLFVDFDGKHFVFRHHHAHPTSQLVLPIHSAPSTLA